jgi:hypothetical protein
MTGLGLPISVCCVPWGALLIVPGSAGRPLQRWPGTFEFRIAESGNASENWKLANMSGQSIGRAKEASI